MRDLLFYANRGLSLYYFSPKSNLDLAGWYVTDDFGTLVMIDILDFPDNMIRGLMCPIVTAD